VQGAPPIVLRRLRDEGQSSSGESVRRIESSR
jgi:hypothetical protein